MKQYAILTHYDRQPVIVSTNSTDYAYLLQAGYTVVFEGNKRTCLEIMQENEMEMSY